MVKETKATVAKTKGKTVYKKTQPVRLYQKGIFTSFRRTKDHQQENQALVAIKNCNDLQGARFYLGKRVAYIYKVKTTSNNTRYRCKWGTVMATHGTSGMVRVKFSKNITGSARGSSVRVMLYPNRTI
jgi:large subunit ribosomal protein L35Ae